MEVRQSFKGFQGKIAFRLVVIVFLVLGLIPFLLAAGNLFGGLWNGGERARTEALEACEYDYYNGDYAALLNTLEMYGETGEEFDRYWEMGRAYAAYQEWQVYAGAAELPDIGEEESLLYEEKAVGCEETVRGYYGASQDQENKAILKSLTDRMEQPEGAS